MPHERDSETDEVSLGTSDLQLVDVANASNRADESADRNGDDRKFDPPDDSRNVFYDLSNLPIEDQQEWEKRMIYRVFLRSPYPAAIWLVNTWYSVHLGLVNEMSLFPQNALKKGVQFRCCCDLLSVSNPDVEHNLYVEIKALEEDERRWTGNEGLSWPGLSGGKGALSIRISPKTTEPLPDFFLLRIRVSKGKVEDSLHVMPLIVGPFKLTGNEKVQLTGEELLLMHRQIPLSSPRHGNGHGSVIIRESPEIAIPGKIWDSALFAAPCALQKLRTTTTVSPHVLDLSSGTGVCGLWMAAEISSNYDDGSVTITDLDEAIPVMSTNIALNRHLISSSIKIDVRLLRWGNSEDLFDIPPVDVLIACDLIYEAELLSSLVFTLNALTTPGRTNVIVGYKQRGLSKAEKLSLWSTFEKDFMVERLDAVTGTIARPCQSSFVGVELWRLWKPLTVDDNRS